MKKATKSTNVVKAKAKYALKSKKKISSNYPKNRISKHLKLVEHSQTGKLIHHRHTSHLVLFVILLILGLFLLASESYVQSYSESGTVIVGTIVPGPAPGTGATISYPLDNDSFDSDVIDIKGTCDKGSFVIVRNNNIMAGSVSCTEAGVFSLQIQLQTGRNVLSVLNYDNLNQVGPVTPTVTVYLKDKGEIITSIEPAISSPSVQSLPVNPTTISGLNNNFSDCSNYNIGELPVDDKPHITIVCTPRLFLPEIPQVLGVLAWGGTAPYAVSVDLGDGTSELLSIPSAGYKTLKFSYTAPNIYKISFKLKDQSGKTAVIHTSVQVSGQIAESESASSGATSTKSDNIIISSINNTPTSLYLVAITATLGFWGGDLFDRKFGSGKVHKRKRKAV